MKSIVMKKVIIIAVIVFIFGFAGGIFTNQHFFLEKTASGWQLLPKTKETINFDLFWRVWSLSKERYVKQPVSDKDLFYGALKGIVFGLKDPYSVFLDPDLANKFSEEMAGNFDGIGIEIGIKDNRLTVIAPLPDTPAARAGLRSGDKIYAIDNKDTSNMSTDEAASLIRGQKGTKVVLTIWRKGEAKTRDVELIRDTINVKTVSWELKGNNIAYIKLSHFSDNTLQDFQNIARVVLNANPKGLILDLRNNPGGYLDTAVDIAGYWLGNEKIVSARDAKNYEKEYFASGRAEFKNIPAVVLTNQGSASASEILAGALQDYKQATILGEKTFGKGSVQELESFSDGSALKLTIAYWYTPLGRSINEEGITPDVEVKMTDEDYNLERDPQLDQALEILGGTPEKK